MGSKHEAAVNLELVFSADDSMMSSSHVGCVSASVLLDIKTAGQWLQCAVHDAD